VKQRLTKVQERALEYFALDFAESDEPGAGWFAYTTEDTPAGYPGSSCETIEDAARWFIEELHERADTTPPPF
jgi:hypothetical protein